MQTEISLFSSFSHYLLKLVWFSYIWLTTDFAIAVELQTRRLCKIQDFYVLLQLLMTSIQKKSKILQLIVMI